MLFSASQASAGGMIVTGHDADDHCSEDGYPQCHFVEVAVSLARDSAPDPTKPLLILDCTTELTAALSLSSFPQDKMKVDCPSLSPGLALDDGGINGGPPTTADWPIEELTPDNYSAIVVGSSCGDGKHPDPLNSAFDCTYPGNSLPDSDAIAARSADIAAYFAAGGGIVALSGEVNGDGDLGSGTDTYYDFLPVPVAGATASSPYTLTNEGEQLGFEDAMHDKGASSDDINCCEAHNAFEEPAVDSPWQVAERDDAGLPATMFVEQPNPLPPAPPDPPQQPDTGQQQQPPTNTTTPKAQESVVIDNAGGQVFVTVPGSKKPVPVNQLKSIPLGSIVDATKGVVVLTSIADSTGKTQTAKFYEGIFIVKQVKAGKLLITELTLTGGNLDKCLKRKSKTSVVNSKTTKKRHLWGDGTGNFRTKGRRSSATVRGTKWLTEDRCNGTWTKVARGKVLVRDFGKKKTVLVKPGQHYLALL